MAEPEDWTAADDARLKAALTGLRADIDETPLPEVAFVKARGARRRRRQVLAWTASAAAAAVAVGVGGFATLGRTPAPAPLPPAHTTRDLTTAARASSSLDQPGALPLLQEWTSTLGLRGAARLTPARPLGPVECLSSEPGTKVQQEQVTLDAGGFEGGQTRFRIPSDQEADTAAQGVASDIAGCQAGPGFAVSAVRTTAWPRLYSYTAGTAGSGWFVVAHGTTDVVVLQVVDPAHPTSSFTRSQVGALAQIATTRLARYATAAATPSRTSSPTTPTTGAKAVDEHMPVSGVQPLISSDLFVAASQWASPALTAGARTTAGPGEPDGGLGGMVRCETSDYLSGIAGRYGIVRIRAGQGAASYIGSQRVRLFEDVDAASLAKADLDRSTALLAKGCDFPNGTVRSTPGRSRGTYRLDVVFRDGSPTISEWVGVTTQRTVGAVSTVMVTKAAVPEQAFAELDRLLALARQK